MEQIASGERADLGVRLRLLVQPKGELFCRLDQLGVALRLVPKQKRHVVCAGDEWWGRELYAIERAEWVGRSLCLAGAIEACTTCVLYWVGSARLHGTTKTPWRLLSFTGDDVVVSRVPGRMPCMLGCGAGPKREGSSKRKRALGQSHTSHPKTLLQGSQHLLLDYLSMTTRIRDLILMRLVHADHLRTGILRLGYMFGK